MSKIIGATVGTPISPKRVEEKIKPVKTVNNQEPDENGNVNIDVPQKTSELENNSGFITKTVSDLTNYYLKSETFSKAEINALVSAIPKFAIEVVSALPTSNISATTVYLLKDGTGGDLYTEYIYTNGAWEILGSQRVDLTGYALKEDIPTKLSDLDNDAGYITKAVSDLVNYYKKSEVYSKDEIDKKGFLTEHQDISGKLDANKLPEAINAALEQAKESGEFDGEDGKDGKDYSFDPTVYDLPVLYLTGDISPIKVSKDNEVTLSYVYGERSGTCKLKGQGSSSYKMATDFIAQGKAGKFNYTIKFDNAFEAKEGWGSQKKYCLKANWIDHSHSRNVVSCKLWGMSVKARSTVPTELKNLPNGGAIDGFPVVVMVNGEFHGLYTFNIPKDGWMFGLAEDSTKTQAVFSAHQHSDATQFKGTLKGDESDFELEFISDESNTSWATASLNRLINACVNSWGGDLDTEVAKYLDWDSAIDYYIHCVVEKGSDAVDKNFLLVTFDGTKWYFTNYDRDTICGLAWDGSALDRPVSDVNFIDCKNTSRVFELIYRFKTNALKARYQQLRDNILSESRINQIYENFAWAIPSPVALEDVKKYPTIRGSFVNGVDQICRWMRQRLEACDKWINEIPAQETPVEPDKPVEMVNLVPTSTDTDGSIYNGVGYKENVRLSSSGGVSSSAQNGTVTIGFMPWQSCGVVRVKGGTIPNNTGRHYYVNFYDATKTFMYHVALMGYIYEPGTISGTLGLIKGSYDETTGILTFDFSGLASSAGTAIGEAAIDATYFRICVDGKGSDLIVTVNQEITV